MRERAARVRDNAPYYVSRRHDVIRDTLFVRVAALYVCLYVYAPHTLIFIRFFVILSVLPPAAASRGVLSFSRVRRVYL